MSKIAWNDVPAWAQQEIRKAGNDGISQFNIAGASLQVVKGKAMFNGRTVAAPGEQVDPADDVEETVEFSALPRWARVTIMCSWGSGNFVTNGAALQISGKTARFDGKLVVKSKSFLRRWLRQMLPF